jgi:hypothetical protein
MSAINRLSQEVSRLGQSLRAFVPRRHKRELPVKHIDTIVSLFWPAVKKFSKKCKKIARQNRVTLVFSVISLSQHILGQARDKMGQNLLSDHDLATRLDDEAGTF